MLCCGTTLTNIPLTLMTNLSLDDCLVLFGNFVNVSNVKSFTESNFTDFLWPVTAAVIWRHTV